MNYFKKSINVFLALAMAEYKKVTFANTGFLIRQVVWHYLYSRRNTYWVTSHFLQIWDLDIMASENLYK